MTDTEAGHPGPDRAGDDGLELEGGDSPEPEAGERDDDGPVVYLDDDGDEIEGLGDPDELGEDDEEVPGDGRRNALPRRVESWRQRTASGAIATALAMGLQQVFEPERRRPAIVQEVPGDPYDDDDPITVDYVPDDAEGTVVHVKPWLLKDELLDGP